MFIRFVCGEVDERSHRAAGLFCAVTQLKETCYLPKYELEAVDEVVLWFERYLASPFDHLRMFPHYDLAVCWFKPGAHVYLAKAWELVTILERNDILIWTIKSPCAGYVYYEDDVQVFAIPYHDVRRRR